MSMMPGRQGPLFQWGNTMREHPKLYPYYQHHECFKHKYNDQLNPLFMTALVKNGGATGRYSTKDTHFDKVGSIRRSFYIPDGTRVQVLCQEERFTLQHLARLGKIFLSKKFTVVWNNRYTYKGFQGKGKDSEPQLVGKTVTLIKFGKTHKKTSLRGKAWKVMRKPFKWMGQFAKEVRKTFGGAKRTPDRSWRVAVIDEKTGKINPCTAGCGGAGRLNKKKRYRIKKTCKACDGRGIELYTVDENELEHVGKDDPSKVRVGGDRKDWEQLEMLGNVNRCSLTDLKAGGSTINPKDVPGYGEVYDHCRGEIAGSKCKSRWLSMYKCNYCTAVKTNRLKKAGS